MPHFRHSRLYQVCDWLTEALIYFAVVFGPWAFGTTQDWSIHVMNGVGFALGLLLLGKLAARVAATHRMNVRVGQASCLPDGRDNESTASASASPTQTGKMPVPLLERQFTTLLAAGTIFILLWCLVSAWNARAIYHADQWHFEYRRIIPWLPHSYDQAASWFAFWQYLGLAGLFWALRDWLLGGIDHETARPRDNETSPDSRTAEVTGSASLPLRLRRLFWVLAINGTALAIQGLLQRAEGGGELLWLVEPHINKAADAQFGPYAYRSNAAQYFNLLWPAVLGFWWAGVSALRRRRSSIRSERRNRLAVLLPCVLIMAVCPFVSASRGGAIVLAGNLILAVGILLMAQWRKSWRAKMGLLLGVTVVVVVGVLLGWQTLSPRMEMLNEGYEAREGLYLAGRYMAQDNPWWGTGPGTFSTLYQLYRQTDEWLAQMHNDWLETVITFGRLGSVPVFLSLLLVLAHWFRGDGIHGNKYFVLLLWASLGGCMVHAFFDFPFQIHSVLALFLMLCAVLSCLTRRGSARALADGG